MRAGQRVEGSAVVLRGELRDAGEAVAVALAQVHVGQRPRQRVVGELGHRVGAEQARRPGHSLDAGERRGAAEGVFGNAVRRRAGGGIGERVAVAEGAVGEQRPAGIGGGARQHRRAEQRGHRGGAVALVDAPIAIDVGVVRSACHRHQIGRAEAPVGIDVGAREGREQSLDVVGDAALARAGAAVVAGQEARRQCLDDAILVVAQKTGKGGGVSDDAGAGQARGEQRAGDDGRPLQETASREPSAQEPLDARHAAPRASRRTRVWQTARRRLTLAFGFR
ncbi:MAG: hypothetical protein U0802_23550 [Candidatus Binatia bacterium]